MKNIAYLLLTTGFLFGAFATALDVDEVNWTIFVAAAIAAVAGVIIAKREDRALSRSRAVLETNRSHLSDALANIVYDLEAVTGITAGETPRGEQLRDWIDARLRPDLRRFADARESMVHLYGMQTYADIMSEFATGERYINRVWSASADGYHTEAENYLARAAKQFRHAKTQLAAAGQR